MSSDDGEMNLNALYQQIFAAEHQLSENSRHLHQVNAAVSETKGKLNSFTETLEQAWAELDEKTRLESELMLQLKLVKRQQQEIQKKKEELLQQQNELKHEQERMGREAAEEKEKFRKELRTFNRDYNLLTDRDLLFQKQTRAELQSLQSEAEALTQEIERMKREKTQLMSLQTVKESFSADLQGLHSKLADLDKEMEEAVALTDSLKTEREAAILKPQTDSTILRLKKDLEAHEELEMLHVALSTELQYLRSK